MTSAPDALTTTMSRDTWSPSPVSSSCDPLATAASTSSTTSMASLRSGLIRRVAASTAMTMLPSMAPNAITADSSSGSSSSALGVGRPLTPRALDTPVPASRKDMTTATGSSNRADRSSQRCRR